MSANATSFTSKFQAIRLRTYRRFFKPRSTDEDIRRREFIFNVLLAGAITLLTITFLVMLIGELIEGDAYPGSSPLVILVPTLVLVGLYWASRRGFNNILPYLFLLIYVALGTYALYLYGYVLPEGLLTYAIVIVVAGILISTRAALIMAAMTMFCLLVISYLQVQGISHPDLSQQLDPLRPVNVLVYTFLFAVILLTSWLSTREIERSLKRARRSEAALRRERNSLEDKVRERTKELEQMQAEKLMELHRFAEFGRLSSTLLHELANPLTSVSLELEHMENKGHASLVTHARQGVAHMERYVESARRQLRSQSEIKVFDSSEAIKKVIDFMQMIAKQQQVTLVANLAPASPLYGDSVRFDQIIANLIANSIDAYSEVTGSAAKIVTVTSKRRRHELEIIVHDRGSGIKAPDPQTVFQPFYTTKSEDRGTGIGLQITKRSVEEGFYGTIHAESNRAGTRFKVLLPLYEVRN